ncbi:hypothetical protein HMI54_005874, partial [Coelomomyces lativittatus]
KKKSLAAEYLISSNPSTWAVSHFPIARFGFITSNSGESKNSWIEDLRNRSYLNILYSWTCKVGEKMFKKSTKYKDISTIFPASAQERLNKNLLEGQKREVKRFSEFVFQVKCLKSGSTQIVKLYNKTCTCGLFQELQFPYVHAAVFIMKFGLDSKDFVHKSYLSDSLKAFYSNYINPVGLEELVSDNLTLPPNVIKKVGCPKTHRI